MSEIGDLYVVLRAVTEPFNRSIKEAAAEGEASSTRIGGAFQRLSNIGVVAGGAALAIGAVSVKWAADFETQMTRLYTAAGLSNEQLKAVHMTSQQLDDAVLKLGNETGFTGTQMAEALYHPISAGLDLKSALEVVKYSAEEARISGASLDDTTYSLSSVMKAFNFEASQAGPTMASLNAIVGEGDMRFQDFNQSIKNWAPTAAQMGISLNSMGAGLAYLTDRGNSAEVAATRMTMGISMMTTPSKQATSMLVGLGLASTDVSASSDAMQQAMRKSGITQNQLALDLKKPDGLYVALKDLKDGLEKAGVSGTEADSVLAKIFGGGRSDKAILSLMQNLDGLKQKYDAISNDSSMSHFQDAWAKTQQTFTQQLHETEATLVNLGIKIGTILLPYVQKFLGWVRVGVDWLMQHKGAAELLAGALATALVAAIVAVGSALAAAFGPELLIAAGIMAVGAAVVYAYNHFKLFREIVDGVGRFLGGVFAAAWHVAAGVIHWFATTVLPPVQRAIDRLFAWFAAHSGIFVAAWRKMVQDVQNWVHWFDQQVLAWVKARLADLTAWWHEHSAQISFLWRAMVKGIGIDFKLLWDLVLHPLLTIMAAVWKAHWAQLRDTVVLVWRIVSGAVTFGMHLIMNTIGLVLDIISGDWGKVWRDLGRMASQSLHDAEDWILGIVSGWGTLLYDAGQNIVEGLINGIYSMVSAAGHAASSIAGYIRSYLPFSPAKRGPLSGSGSPEIAGAKIGSMLADGMSASIGTVSRVSGKLAGAAVLSVTGGEAGGAHLAALAAGGSQGAGAPPVVNYIFNIAGNAVTMDQLSRDIEAAFLRRGARNPFTYQPYKR